MRHRFGRYEAGPGVQGEFEPGSGRRVLRNKLGIRSKRVMDEMEYATLVASQAQYLRTITPQTRFTAALLRDMHKAWLGRVYAWAGQYRTVDVRKEDFTWPPASLVADNMARFERTLLATHTPCAHGDVTEVARRIAEVHGELLLIHPFREGNGRLARWLADLMTLQAGLPEPHYRFTGRGSKAVRAWYLEAVRQAYSGEPVLLSEFFREMIGRRLG